MKKLFLLFVASIMFATINSQDKVVLKNGEVLNVKIVKNDEKSIEYQYAGETLLNVMSKKGIKFIIFESGRKEEYHQGLDVPTITSAEDWPLVVETYLESDVEGLTRVGELKTTSGWGGSLGSTIGYKDCIKRLKKKAAKMGAGVILIHGQPNQSASARGGNVQVIATAYK